MTSLTRDSDNDIVIQNGRFKISSGKSAYKQILESAILTIQGELQLDTGRGIPYFDTVFKSIGGIANWKSYVEDTINGFDFVKSISSFNYDIDSDKKTLSYTLVIETDDGTIEISG